MSADGHVQAPRGADTVAHADDAGGTGLIRAIPARQASTVLAIAKVEAWLLIRSALMLAGLLAGGLVTWIYVGSTQPLWWNAAWEIGYGQVILAGAVLAATQLAAGRVRRDGMAELYDSFPASASTRTLAHLCALIAAVPASLLLLGGATAWINSRGAIGTPSTAALAGGLLLVIAAGAAGIAVGARFAHPLAGLLSALLLFVLFNMSDRFPGAIPWLFPWTVPDQLSQLPGPLTGYPPTGAHAVELAGIAILISVAALAVATGRRWHPMRLAVAGTLAVAVICASGAAQLRAVPTGDLNRLVSAAVQPTSVQNCTTANQVRYCLYPGFGAMLSSLQAPVNGVLAHLPARPAQPLSIGQAMLLSLNDPPLTHGHPKSQLAQWNAELRKAPANVGAASAIYVTVGNWPAGSLTDARFALALGTAEWAVNLPPTGNPNSPVGGCVALDQAREAIAIWLAIAATHASAGELQGGRTISGGPGTAGVDVHDKQVVTWNSPGESAGYTSAPGPTITAAGYLLARAMTRLPTQQVTRVLDSAWPALLNWHTTDAQLAAALGIPMPVVPTIKPFKARDGRTIVVGPPPGAASPQNSLCTT